MPNPKWATLALAGAAVALLLIVHRGLWCSGPFGKPLSCPTKAVACVLGEAEGESYTGKLILAHALINRGSFMAVYGCDSKRVRQKLYPRKALIEATMAWTEAVKTHKENDLANGAANWLSVEDYCKGNTWMSLCDPRVVVGNHLFVKCP